MRHIRSIATAAAIVSLAIGAATTAGTAHADETVIIGPQLNTFVREQRRVIVLQENRGRIVLDGDRAVFVRPGQEEVVGTYKVEQRRVCVQISQVEDRCYTFYREAPDRILVRTPGSTAPAGTVIVE